MDTERIRWRDVSSVKRIHILMVIAVWIVLQGSQLTALKAEPAKLHVHSVCNHCSFSFHGHTYDIRLCLFIVSYYTICFWHYHFWGYLSREAYDYHRFCLGSPYTLTYPFKNHIVLHLHFPPQHLTKILKLLSEFLSNNGIHAVRNTSVVLIGVSYT